ncbi:response regulator [Candidatus Nitrosotenuis chungbukensis]|uniref:response regulator n=1 Tax=Candidatus Nitrosotenuis chungbukensis TaxID=1353246 RepID=UPI0026712D87|nr:response regulator [Candidatus Nitrosotenuis chungbukensis]WKT57965.1 response regulator [Candidatus Nitrosotenuis chungbukensis]
MIDDDRDTVEVFVDYLKILNVNVLTRGYCGKDAVELYERHRPDMVFLDLMMADYDGFYALERIRKINPDAKVIVVTADLRSDIEMKLSALKPTEVVFKPFAPEILEEIVKKYKSA